MIDLITIKAKEDGTQTVSARELHEKLQIGTRYDIWFNRMCEYGFVENVDYILVDQKRSTNNPKNPEITYIEHYISIDAEKNHKE